MNAQIKKKTYIKNAKRAASIAILYLFPFKLCDKERNIATVLRGSIITKYKIHNLEYISNILNNLK